MMQLVQSLPARNIVPPGEYQKLSTKSTRIKQKTEVKKKKPCKRQQAQLETREILTLFKEIMFFSPKDGPAVA